MWRILYSQMTKKEVNKQITLRSHQNNLVRETCQPSELCLKSNKICKNSSRIDMQYVATRVSHLMANSCSHSLWKIVLIILINLDCCLACFLIESSLCNVILFLKSRHASCWSILFKLILVGCRSNGEISRKTNNYSCEPSQISRLIWIPKGRTKATS